MFSACKTGAGLKNITKKEKKITKNGLTTTKATTLLQPPLLWTFVKGFIRYV